MTYQTLQGLKFNILCNIEVLLPHLLNERRSFFCRHGSAHVVCAPNCVRFLLNRLSGDRSSRPHCSSASKALLCSQANCLTRDLFHLGMLLMLTAYGPFPLLAKILNHFGSLDEELLEKQRYAVWRAADIRKALREGRPPTPPTIRKTPPPQVAQGSSGDGEERGAESMALADLPLAYAEIYDGSAAAASPFSSSSFLTVPSGRAADSFKAPPDDAASAGGGCKSAPAPLVHAAFECVRSFASEGESSPMLPPPHQVASISPPVPHVSSMRHTSSFVPVFASTGQHPPSPQQQQQQQQEPSLQQQQQQQQQHLLAQQQQLHQEVGLQRYVPGSKVLFCEGGAYGGGAVEAGTVGQVVQAGAGQELRCVFSRKHVLCHDDADCGYGLQSSGSKRRSCSVPPQRGEGERT